MSPSSGARGAETYLEGPLCYTKALATDEMQLGPVLTEFLDYSDGLQICAGKRLACNESFE